MRRKILKMISFLLSVALIILGGLAVESAVEASQFIIGFLGIVSGLAGIWLYFTKP
jgi:hypothetical protein